MSYLIIQIVPAVVAYFHRAAKDNKMMFKISNLTYKSKKNALINLKEKGAALEGINTKKKMN